MNEDEMKAIFTLAGIPVTKSWRLQNGYLSRPSQQKETDPDCALYIVNDPWWLVRTPIGLIEIGWRKRVISINWKDSEIRKIVTEDDVTKEDYLVHAWSVEKAISYLRALVAGEAK